VTVPALYDRFDRVSMHIALQPIMAVREETIFAYEALARFGRGVDTAEQFRREAERGSARLNLAAVHNALDAFRTLPDTALLFLNVDPIALAAAELPDLVRDGAARNNLDLARIVLEITERSPLHDLDATSRAVTGLHRSGVRFALDDFGSAHSHLPHLDLIRPAFLKIGHGFGSAFETSATRTAIVRHIAALARDLDCATVLEGVETPETAGAVRDLGIDLAQGHYFGRPVIPLHAFRGR
jgi:EAL domain-containing protein (putative c-di-GMP-specific phosphodiesterase class I)